LTKFGGLVRREAIKESRADIQIPDRLAQEQRGRGLAVARDG
jgi:hypothetical protein